MTLTYVPDFLESVDQDLLPAFYDINLFPRLQGIVDATAVIRDELLHQDTTHMWQPYDQSWLVEQGDWQMLPLLNRRHDSRHTTAIKTHADEFKRTLEILTSCVGLDLYAAGFSLFRPGTVLREHRGWFGNLLRAHLPITVPEGDCGITVKGESQRWHHAQLLLLDDRMPHLAWNHSDQDRIVLVFDFVPHELGGDFLPRKHN